MCWANGILDISISKLNGLFAIVCNREYSTNNEQSSKKIKILKISRP